MDSSRTQGFVCVLRGRELGSMCGDCRNHRARLPDWLTARSLARSLASPLLAFSPRWSVSLSPRCLRYLLHGNAPNALCCTLLHCTFNVSPIYLRPYATALPSPAASSLPPSHPSPLPPLSRAAFATSISVRLLSARIRSAEFIPAIRIVRRCSSLAFDALVESFD